MALRNATDTVDDGTWSGNGLSDDSLSSSRTGSPGYSLTCISLRALQCLPWALLSLAAATCLAISLHVVTERTVTPGEAEILHEASRIRDGFSLYVDATIGEYDYGGPPSRVWVLYPPFTSWLVSLLPERNLIPIGRIVSALTFVVALAVPVIAAPHPSRQNAGLAALVVGSVFAPWLYTSVIRPDSLAILFIAVFLERTSRLGNPDALVGILAGISILLKPNMSGAPIGVLVGGVLWSRGPGAVRARGAVAAATVTLLIGLGTLFAWSGGTFAEHLLRSFGHRCTLSNLVSSVVPRLTSVLAPFLLATVLLIRNSKTTPARILSTAFVASLATTGVALSRFGSASNYWLEPLVVVLVVVSKETRWPIREKGPMVRGAVALLLSLQSGILVYLTVEGAFDLRRNAAADQSLRARARERCGGIVRSDQPGIEYEMNGRILATNFTLNHAMVTGHFPTKVYVDELLDPLTDCVVTTASGADPFASFIEPSRPFLATQFELDSSTRSGRLYVRKRAKENGRLTGPPGFQTDALTSP